MSANTSKSREQAEAAFSKTQTEFLARSRNNAELDAVANERDQKTARLKEMRKAKEAADLAAKTDEK